MRKNVKTIVLSILIIITTFLIIRRATIIYLEFKNINLPTKESRQIGNMSTHKWLTVKKISQKNNISEDEIFKTLEIIPQVGDENLNVEELGKKYNKTSKELKDNLKKIIENSKDTKNSKRIESNNLEGKKHE
jgi:CRISPR/Cas system CMR subunit Cmr6 (Cas7 group RAMP superfamily)